jgi:hypothetical protein
MGGYGAWHFAFKYPQLFCYAGPFAAGGSYGANGIVQNYSPAEDPHKLAVSNAAILSAQMKVYVCVGSNDGLTSFNLELVNICKAQKIPYVYTVVPNIGHDFNGLMVNNGLQAVQYVTQGLAPVSVDPRASTVAKSNVATILMQGRTLRIGAPHAQPLTIELFSLSGKMAGSYRTFGERTAKLDLSHFVRGAYCVRLQSTSGIMEKRIFLN